MARKNGGKSRNDFKRKEDRREKARKRQAARDELSDLEQIVILEDRGHLNCKEIGRLRKRMLGK